MSTRNFARIENGVVAETIRAETATVNGKPFPGLTVVDRQVSEDTSLLVDEWPVMGERITPLFPDHQDWRPAPDEVAAGWSYDGETYAPPQLPPIDLKDYARHVSRLKRIGGAPINGLYVPTDSDSIGLITGMVTAAQIFPDRVFNFDSPAGTIPMTAPAAIVFGTQVLDFIQSTFDRRAEVLAAIDAGDISSSEEIDAAFADL